MSSTTFQSLRLGNQLATISSRVASINLAAVVAPLQPGRMVPKVEKGYVAHLSASKKRQPSYDADKQASRRFDALLPHVVVPDMLVELRQVQLEQGR